MTERDGLVRRVHYMRSQNIMRALCHFTILQLNGLLKCSFRLSFLCLFSALVEFDQNIFFLILKFIVLTNKTETQTKMREIQ